MAVLSVRALNTIRSERAELRQRVKAVPRVESCALVADLLESPPVLVRSVDIGVLLCWPTRFSKGKAAPLLAALNISPVEPVGGLSEEQRFALARALRSVA